MTGGPLDGGDTGGPSGWIPPEDRTWRHPSELAAAGAGAGGAGGGTPVLPAPLPPGPDRRHRYAATVGVGFGAAAAVLIGVFLLANAGSGPGPSMSAVSQPPSLSTAMTGCCKVVPAVARSAQRAMVALMVSTDGGVNQGCGVAVAAGGLVATTADAVDGAQSVTAVTASGKRVKAHLVAVDRSSDVALLRVNTDLPVVPMADDGTVAAGHPAMVMAVAARTGPGAADATMWSQGTVRSVATAVQGGDADGMAAVTTGATQVPAVPGSALLTAGGQLLGLLDATGRPMSGDGEEAFLPTQLVVGVAKALASHGVVDHGWLDVKGHDAPDGTVHTTASTAAAGTATSVTDPPDGGTDGALVTSVESSGAAGGALNVGDVVVSLDGAPVRSMAELRTRLYVLGPGSTVRLGVDRGGSLIDVAVTLAPSP